MVNDVTSLFSKNWALRAAWGILNMTRLSSLHILIFFVSKLDTSFILRRLLLIKLLLLIWECVILALAIILLLLIYKRISVWAFKLRISYYLPSVPFQSIILKRTGVSILLLLLISKTTLFMLQSSLFRLHLLSFFFWMLLPL